MNKSQGVYNMLCGVSSNGFDLNKTQNVWNAHQSVDVRSFVFLSIILLCLEINQVLH